MGGWAASAEPEAPSDRYELRNLLGQGGMGRVWIAWDHHLQREVALKELHPDQVDAARLRAEAALTARLDHPGIIAVYDIGELPDGRPFYTMRLVRGHPLGERISAVASEEERRRLLRVVLSVCEAVSAAHRAGVVHRDLKPDNVLLGEAGEVQVVDWGLAAATSRSPGETGPVGTPRWMSPEQAEGVQPEPASDVWSLGALLYNVVSGRSPYEGDRDNQMRARRAGPPVPIHDVAPGTSPALATVIQRALAHAPADRYPSAVELSADLSRYLDGRLVQAHAYTPWELVRHAAWTARFPLAGLALISAVGLVAAGVAFERIRTERDRALSAEREAEHARDTAEGHLASAHLEQAIREALDGDRQRASELARQVLAVRDDPTATGILAGFSRAPMPRMLTDLPAPPCERRALSRDGRRLACSHGDRVELIDVASGEILWSLPGRAFKVDFARDGRELDVWTEYSVGRTVNTTTGEASAPKATPTWPVANSGPLVVDSNGAPLGELPCFARTMITDQTRRRIATLCNGGRVLVGTPAAPAVLDVQTELLGRVHASAAAISQSGRWLALGTLRGGAAAMDLRTGAVRHDGLDMGRGIVHAVAISPDDRLMALARDSGGVAIWNVQTGVWLAEVEASVDSVVAFAGHDELVVVGDRTRRWDLSDLGPPHRVRTPTGVAEVATDRDGRHAYIGLSTGAVERLDVRTGERERVLPEAQDTVKALAPLPGGGVVATRLRPGDVVAVRDGSVETVWNEGFRRLVRLHDGRLLSAGVGTRALEQEPGGNFREVLQTGKLEDMEASPDGRSAVAVEQGEVLHLWREGRGWTSRPLDPLGGSADVRDDGLIARSTPDGVRLEDPAGALLAELAFEGRPLDVRFSEDGRLLAASSHEGPIHVWRVEGRRRIAILIGHTERVDNIAFSPDGSWLVSGGWDHQVRIWDLSKLRVMDADPTGR